MRSVMICTLQTLFGQSRMGWVGHVAPMVDRRSVYRFVVGNHEGKRPFEIPRRRWEDNVKLVLKKFGWKRVDWIDSTHDKDKWRTHVIAVMKIRLL